MGNILYQSPDYRPEIVTKRYVYVELGTNKPVLVETNAKKLNVRVCEISGAELEQYAYEISEADKIKHLFPYCVEITK